MNRNRHIQYRRSVYRRRRIRLALITGAVVIVVLFALFLILGNIFDNKTKESFDTDKNRGGTYVENALPADAVRSIKASSVSLTQDAGSFFSSVDALAAGGAREISVRMNAEDGKLYYYSDIADRMGYSIEGGGISLEDIVSAADSHGAYVSAVYYIGAFSEEDALARSVLLSEFATVVSEVLMAGVDEAVLIAPDISAEACSEVKELISRIKGFAPNAKVGFSLPDALVNSADASLIDALASEIDFLALDLTGYGENDPVPYAEEKLSSMLYYLLRYKMRALIPSVDGADTQNKLIAAVENESVSSWQIIS